MLQRKKYTAPPNEWRNIPFSLFTFAGMNLNVRVKGQHVDFEEKTYYASFSGELEASASPMWALVSHLKDNNTREYTVNVLKHCLTAIREWMEDVQFDAQDKVSLFKVYNLNLATTT